MATNRPSQVAMDLQKELLEGALGAPLEGRPVSASGRASSCTASSMSEFSRGLGGKSVGHRRCMLRLFPRIRLSELIFDLGEMSSTDCSNKPYKAPVFMDAFTRGPSWPTARHFAWATFARLDAVTQN